MDPTTTPADGNNPAQSPPAPVPDAGTAGGGGLSPDEAARVVSAASGAVEQHLAESRRGKRGPDKSPRKLPPQCLPRAPLDLGLGNSPGPAPGPEVAPVPLAVDWQEPAPFDEATCREMVNIALGLLNDGASAIVRAVAKNQTGDDNLAEVAAKAVRMSEQIHDTIQKGAIACAKKYCVRLDYAPEIMFGGGMVIWAGQAWLTIKELRATGAALRSSGAPQ